MKCGSTIMINQLCNIAGPSCSPDESSTVKEIRKGLEKPKVWVIRLKGVNFNLRPKLTLFGWVIGFIINY